MSYSKSKQLAKSFSRVIFGLLLCLSSALALAEKFSEEAIHLLLESKKNYANQPAQFKFEKDKYKKYQLCRDFKAYVNRQTPYYYFVELKPDSLFTGFTLPKLTPVSKAYALNVLKADNEQIYQTFLARALDEQAKVRMKARAKEAWQELIQGNANHYKASIDINHSGKKEQLLITQLNYPLYKDFYSSPKKVLDINTSLYRYALIDEQGQFMLPQLSIGIEYTGLKTGMPFYYRGRFYLVSFGYAAGRGNTSLTIGITEPSVSPFTQEGINYNTKVCGLRMRVDDQLTNH